MEVKFRPSSAFASGCEKTCAALTANSFIPALVDFESSVIGNSAKIDVGLEIESRSWGNIATCATRAELRGRRAALLPETPYRKWAEEELGSEKDRAGEIERCLRAKSGRRPDESS